ncbi:P-loop containing nucleoside triphosphate hydrolase protein, partial [Patellaria atrata CBS 101060]
MRTIRVSNVTALIGHSNTATRSIDSSEGRCIVTILSVGLLYPHSRSLLIRPDEELLNLPHGDRARAAAEGRARLTLAPRQDRQTMQVDGGLQSTLEDIEYKPTHQSTQFAYNGLSTQQSSSSPRGQPSSPAFKASQRRASGQRVRETPRTPKNQQRSEYINASTSNAIPINTTNFAPSYNKLVPKQIALSHAPPIAQGIQLISTHSLPDRFRSVFPMLLFNAIQSKSFDCVYESNENFVLSAPTGSGKTAVLELAICRAVTTYPHGRYKIVYQAPTKSLCSERWRDWTNKFSSLNLECAELTGDSDQAQLRSVQTATIIITTPEKWDSMTRKWKDHERLMQLVKLFLIDEVHILKEDRGATLEAVVSRMKSVGSDVRFIALSATVPNSDDIATWLGKDSLNQHVPATRERFGEEFRPVKLQRHVVGYQGGMNDFAFEKILDSKLPEVITKYSQKKPIMIFCCTRKSTIDTAKVLANWWSTKGPRDRHWQAPQHPVRVGDLELKGTVTAGVAFHHGGVDAQDRQAIEKGFLHGNISVICCTSTLAVGVNLPCHFVIIKNTMMYQGGTLKEYPDLEIMQMLGRAGRPQFEDSAIAVIMTRIEKAKHYEKMASGQEILESCLHLNLIEHMNAEIGLGTIRDVHSARTWLTGTFLYVRLQKNPNHYRLEGDIDVDAPSLDEKLDRICSKSIKLLQEYDLVTADPRLCSTEFGDAMARYYLQFQTMKVFLGLQPKAKLSELLSCLAQAAEFREIRFRAGEKPIYKQLNTHSFLKFPIPVDLTLPAHKVSLVIQAVLGGIDLPTNEQKHKMQFQTEIGVVFQHVHRLIRCIIDCQLYLEDSISTRNALTLGRSLAAKVWDDSPAQLKQIEGIGNVSIIKLAKAGIRSIEALENTESHRIDMILSKHPPYGAKLLDKLKGFPKLRVQVNMMGYSVMKNGDGVRVNVKAEMGFINDRPPLIWHKRPVYVCMLAETSDGNKVHFCRISAQKLGHGQEALFSAILTSATQSITCYIMSGTQRQATLKPDIPASKFPPPKRDKNLSNSKPGMNTSKRRSESGPNAQRSSPKNSDFFGDDDIDDADLERVELDEPDFTPIDIYDTGSSGTSHQTRAREKNGRLNAPQGSQIEREREPTRLPNGKWACNHQCKDKTSCKHFCCREGIDKPPKKSVVKNKIKDNANEVSTTQRTKTKSQDLPKPTQKTQTKLSLSPTKKRRGPELLSGSSIQPIEEVDLTEQPSISRSVDEYKNKKERTPYEAKKLDRVHKKVQQSAPAPLRTLGSKKPAYDYAAGHSPRLSFLSNEIHRKNESSDYDDGVWEDILTTQCNDFDTTVPARNQDDFDLGGEEIANGLLDSTAGNDDYEDERNTDTSLEAAMIGLADSQDLQ